MQSNISIGFVYLQNEIEKRNLKSTNTRHALKYLIPCLKTLGKYFRLCLFCCSCDVDENKRKESPLQLLLSKWE